MNVAVTGGAGFIGSHVVDRLVAAGHRVVVVDPSPPHRCDVEHRPVDILDLAGLTSALEGCDAVFHLAAVADVNQARNDPAGTWELNVVGTARVWDAARQAGVGRAVLASTVWVYGGAVGPAPLHEDVPFALPELEHVYTASKVAAELVAHTARSLYGQEFTILRYGIPYGPRMRPALVIPRFVSAALAGERLTIDGDGSQFRNYVYVEDLAAAHVLALESPAAANGTFNLEGTEPVSIRRLVESIGAELGPVDVTYGEARPGDYEGRAVSASSAAEVLGWRPTVAFEDGLRRYIDWHRAQAPALEARVARSGAPVLRERRLTRPRAILTTATLSLVVLPLLLGPTNVSLLSRLAVAAATAAGGTLAWGITRARSRLAPAPVAVLIAGGAAWLLSQTESITLVALLAIVLGAGLGLLLSSRSRRVAFSRKGLAFSGATAVFTAALAGWIGATSASASWFGAQVSHGSRQSNQVAITFDRVGSPTMTRELRSELDRVNAKATFFATPWAVEAHADVMAGLVAHGDTIATDDARRSAWLRPGYRDVRRSQRVFHDRLGVCPTFFRQAEGRHTPWGTQVVHRDGMVVVGWDVGTTGRLDRDGLSLALHVLGKVEPGSIIALHLPPSNDTQRSAALARALPLIVDGLRARGLEPVSLDVLLHRAPYAAAC